MTLGDTFALSLRNLRQAKLRSFLTMLGVSIGIASLAGMVSLGVGLQDQFVSRFNRSGMFDAVTVMPGADRPGAAMGGGFRRPGFGRRGRGDAAAPTNQPERDITDE